MGNIEKYGVVALLFVIVMVLAVSIWGDRSTVSLLPEEEGEVAGALETVTPTILSNPEPGSEGSSVARPLVPDAGEAVGSTGSSGAIQKYKIQSGDNLESISRRFLGSPHRWKEIVKLNEGLNPHRMRVGQEILIPSEAAAPKESKKAENASVIVGTAAAERHHVVQRNDTLYEIAVKFYGKGTSWKKIYDANRDKINDPGVLPLGVKIVIPNER